jgi:hypothetical protein
MLQMYAVLIRQQKDMYSFLKNQLNKKDEEIIKLEEKVTKLQCFKEIGERELRKTLHVNYSNKLEAKMHAEKAAAEDINNKLRRDVQKYREEIDELSEFKIQKVS